MPDYEEEMPDAPPDAPPAGIPSTELTMDTSLQISLTDGARQVGYSSVAPPDNPTHMYIPEMSTATPTCTTLSEVPETRTVSVRPRDAPAQETRPSACKTGRTNVCPVCHQRPSKLRVHAEMEHFPWFFSAERVCWTCRISSNTNCFFHQQHVLAGHDARLTDEYLFRWLGSIHTALQNLAAGLGLPSIAALYTWALEKNMHSNFASVRLSATQIIFFRLLARVLHPEEEPPMAYSTASPGTPELVLYWRILLNILAEASDEVAHNFRSAPMSAPIYLSITTIDSHVHMDDVMDRRLSLSEREPFDPPTTGSRQPRARVSRWTRAPRYLENPEEPDPSPPPVRTDLELLQERCIGRGFDSISCFVVSLNWLHSHDFFLQNINEPRYYFTLGLHPHVASRPGNEDVSYMLEMSAANPKCVGIGEVGIDLYKHSAEREVSSQLHYLRHMCQVATRLNKPMVIHCRPSSAEPDKARHLCLEVMSQELSKQHPVYIHCFSDGLDGLAQWLKAFPNIMFGLGRNAMHRSKDEVIKSIDLDRILLETDAPHIFHHPWRIPDVARHIGYLRHLAPSLIMDLGHINARKFFGL